MEHSNGWMSDAVEHVRLHRRVMDHILENHLITDL